MYAAQALEFRGSLKCSAIIEKNHRLIRSKIPKLEEDRLLKNDIDSIIKMVNNQTFTVK